MFIIQTDWNNVRKIGWLNKSLKVSDRFSVFIENTGNSDFHKKTTGDGFGE